MTKKTEIAIATPTMTSLELVAMINIVRLAEGKREIRHDNFLAKIEKVLDEHALKFQDMLNIEIGQGAIRKTKIYRLPKRECDLLVMSESYKVQAVVYDKMFELEQENLKLKQEAEAKKTNRIATKKNFYVLTDAVKTSIEELGREAQSYDYSKEMDLVNQVVLGMDANTFRRIRGIKEGKPIRDFMTTEELKAIADYEKHDYTFLLSGMNYEDRKEVLIKMRTKEVMKSRKLLK